MGDFLLLATIASAVGIGWWLGRVERRPAGGKLNVPAPQDYSAGLSYLLRDKSDDEVEAFVRTLAVSPQTLETHLALGGLFRRRGEADKAIHIHEAVLESPWLESPWPSRVKIELARDYMAAGLLGRAETLLREVDDAGFEMEREEALHLLLEVYQQERDWEHAIPTAQSLLRDGRHEVAPVLAQFYCEIAGEALAAGNHERVRRKLQQALEQDPSCARASLLLGELEVREGNLRTAAHALERILEQDPEFVSECIDTLVHCYQELGEEESLIAFLRRCIDEHPSISAVLALADILDKDGDERLTAHFVAGQLQRRPSIRGLKRLIDLQLQVSDVAARESLEILRGLTAQLLAQKPVYRCRHCGFAGRELHWQCPGCKHWGSVKPIQGLEGE